MRINVPARLDKISLTVHISILCIFIRLALRRRVVVGRNQDVIYELPPRRHLDAARLWRTTEIALCRTRKKRKRKEEKVKEEKNKERKKDLNAPLFALYDRYFPLRRIITDFNLISREVSE